MNLVALSALRRVLEAIKLKVKTMAATRTKAQILSDLFFVEAFEELGDLALESMQIATDEDLLAQREWSAGNNGTKWSNWSPNLVYPELKPSPGNIIVTWSEYHDQYWSDYKNEQERGFYNVEHYETSECSLEELVLKVVERSYLISGPNWINNCSGSFDGYPNIVIHSIQGAFLLEGITLPFELSFELNNGWDEMVKSSIAKLLSKSRS